MTSKDSGRVGFSKLKGDWSAPGEEGGLPSSRKGWVIMVDKVLAACGNDCSACPRYVVPPHEKSEEELRRTAELWARVGYRDRIVSNQEMACTGCKPGNWCRYRIVECCGEKGVATCAQCDDRPCERLQECFEATQSFAKTCRRICTDDEYRLLEKAFFEKEKNLSAAKI